MSPADLKREIEEGPKAGELAPHWNDVFEAEPEPPDAGHPGDPPQRGEGETTKEWDARWGAFVESRAKYTARQRWERLRSRVGALKPDAAAAISEMLRTPDRYVSPEQVAEAKVAK